MNDVFEKCKYSGCGSPNEKWHVYKNPDGTKRIEVWAVCQGCGSEVPMYEYVKHHANIVYYMRHHYTSGDLVYGNS